MFAEVVGREGEILGTTELFNILQPKTREGDERKKNGKGRKDEL